MSGAAPARSRLRRRRSARFFISMVYRRGSRRTGGADTPGDHLRLRIRVTDGAGEPVPDAILELSQADHEGRLAHPVDPGAPRPASGFVGFGRLATNADGVCVFHTIRPGRVADHQGGRQAAHVAVCLFSRGLLRQIYTRVYFAGDPALTQDAVLALVPEDRRATLLAQPDPAVSGLWAIDIRLQGDRETVFFDL